MSDLERYHQNWTGKPLQDLTYEWGAPFSERRLADGRIQTQYRSRTIYCPETENEWTEQCRIDITSTPNGIIQEIVNIGSYSECLEAFTNGPANYLDRELCRDLYRRGN